MSLLLAFYRDPFQVAVAAVSAAAAAVALGWAGELVVRSPVGGVYWDLRPDRVAAAAAMSVATGLVAPLQVAAFNQARAAARARRAAGTTAGALTGLVAVSCCSPLLLPAVAAIVGASGSTVVSLNLTAQRLFVPLTVFSLVLLTLSGALAARDLRRGCRLPNASHATAPEPPGHPCR